MLAILFCYVFYFYWLLWLKVAVDSMWNKSPVSTYSLEESDRMEKDLEKDQHSALCGET